MAGYIAFPYQGMSAGVTGRIVRATSSPRWTPIHRGGRSSFSPATAGCMHGARKRAQAAGAARCQVKHGAPHSLVCRLFKTCCHDRCICDEQTQVRVTGWAPIRAKDLQAFHRSHHCFVRGRGPLPRTQRDGATRLRAPFPILCGRRACAPDSSARIAAIGTHVQYGDREPRGG